VSVALDGSRIALEWPHDPAYRAVGRLVLSGVATRIDLPVDRVDELGLALDTLAEAAVTDDRLVLDVDVAPGRLSVALGTFAADPLADPATRRVVVGLVGEAASVPTGDGGFRVVLTSIVVGAPAG
jgi:hypothetical protein